jgi:predicted ribosomally synthesized peptide with nif11-like leader
MASEAVHQFIVAVNGSPELCRRTQQALEGSSGPADFVVVGREAGFQFSEDDAREYFAEVLTPQQPGEIKDRELEQVAGGKDISLRGPSQLNETVRMFQSMSFNSLPAWTGFKF